MQVYTLTLLISELKTESILTISRCSAGGNEHIR